MGYFALLSNQLVSLQLYLCNSRLAGKVFVDHYIFSAGLVKTREFVRVQGANLPPLRSVVVKFRCTTSVGIFTSDSLEKFGKKTFL